MSIVEESSEIALFRHLSNHVFAVRKFGNTKSMRIIVFFQNFQELIQIEKKQKKIEEKFFLSETIASELVSLICPY